MWQKERACSVLISEFPAPSPAIYINLNNFRLSKLEEKMNKNKQNKTELKSRYLHFCFLSPRAKTEKH